MKCRTRASQVADPVNDPVFVRLAARMSGMSNGMVEFQMISTRGMTHPVPDPARLEISDVRDRGYYEDALAGPPGSLVTGLPVLRKSARRWALPMVLRLEREVAGFSMILCLIDLQRLSEPHETWRMKDKGSILLLRDDGHVLARAPFDPALLGLDLSVFPRFGEMRTRPQGKLVSGSAFSDGVQRIVSYEKLPGHPVFVVSSRGYDEALQPWQTIRRILLLVAALLTLALLATGLVIRRSHRAVFSAQAALHRMAMTDELTGVFNRRAFMEEAARAREAARQAGTALSVLMIDCDHFKQVNDRYGHAVGDEVLQGATRCWREALREPDRLARLGGEEFCVLLPGLAAEDAEGVAERLRQLSAGAQVSAREPALRVTVSIGVASLSAQDADWQSLLARADRALYRAKEEGRNRVVVETPEAV
ncbi:GGDEF domain-containing protein [Uliginosibacterium paludis]|uniref:diguanylate cyclase n=1 Tax=Uliginosibacterium paludis TaxID=1615952 RepID=A0ABV2CW07_9RHOO